MHAAERYSHCAQVLGVYPEYNHMWDLENIGFFNIYAMMPPDPMHVIAGIQFHLISGVLRQYHKALCTEDMNPDKPTWHKFNTRLDARVRAVGNTANTVDMSSHVMRTFDRIYQSASSARGQTTYAWRLKFHEVDMLVQILPFCLREMLVDFVEDDIDDPSPGLIKCVDLFISLIRDMRDPIRIKDEVHRLQHRISEWLLLADLTFPSRSYVGPREVGTARLPQAEPLNHENTAKLHALHHVVMWQFAAGEWNICSSSGMEAKHKEVRITALRVNDRNDEQCDTCRQVGYGATLKNACVHACVCAA